MAVCVQVGILGAGGQVGVATIKAVMCVRGTSCCCCPHSP